LDRRALIVSGVSLLGMGATRGFAQQPVADQDRGIVSQSALAPVGQMPPAGAANARVPAASQGAPPPAPLDSSSAVRNGTEAMPPAGAPRYSNSEKAESYGRDEIIHAASDFLGVTAEAAGSAIERVFSENGRPTGYIAGEETAAAITLGLRYGKGLLYMKNRPTQRVFWQGPSIGFDLRINASRVFTLCYNLQYPDAIFQRFPGVEGSAYFIGGLGVNYQRASDITLAPVRAGVGLGAGANIGYLAYSRRRNWLPF